MESRFIDRNQPCFGDTAKRKVCPDIPRFCMILLGINSSHHPTVRTLEERQVDEDLAQCTRRGKTLETARKKAESVDTINKDKGADLVSHVSGLLQLDQKPMLVKVNVVSTVAG